MTRFIFCVIISLATYSAIAEIPAGYKLSQATISPNGRYGLLVPNDPSAGDTELAVVKTSKILATLTVSEGGYYETESGETSSVWSRDSSLLVWSPSGKWGPVAVNVLTIHNDQKVSQNKILKILQDEITTRLKATQPTLYKKVQSAISKSHAEADGFTVDIHVMPSLDTNSVSFEEGLTSDPNMALTSDLQLQANLKGDISSNARIRFGEFRAYTPNDISKSNKLHDEALNAENKAYERLFRQLPKAKQGDLASEETRWKSTVNNMSDTIGYSFTGARWLDEETSMYHQRSQILVSRLKHLPHQ